MQVRKFEAKSMKEALNLVKLHLGPEAIILSARDNNKGFGLAGVSSVEVTAAVSDETLRKKQLAEAKLNKELREKYQQSPARLQKSFIDKATQTWNEEREKKEPRPMTTVPYISIDNESEAPPAAFIDNQTHEVGESDSKARVRIKNAAQRAYQAIEGLDIAAPVPPKKSQATNESVENEHIRGLREEINYLKGVIDKFNHIPQNFLPLHPGAEDGIPYDLSFIYQKLIKTGLAKELVTEILKKVQAVLPKEQLKKSAFVDAWIARHILDSVKIADKRTAAKYHIFTGVAGQGKTTSLIKLASHLVICEKKKIAIVTTDSSKVGAAEQLRIYAQILNVPFAVIKRKSDWEVIEKKLAGVDHILVDTPGYNLKSIGEIDSVRELMPPLAGGRNIHFVQSVLAKDEDAMEIAGRYHKIGFDDVIFTNLDEAVQHGIILNFQKRFNIPLHSFSIGPQIPEDFEPATKERVVDLIFKISRIKKEK